MRYQCKPIIVAKIRKTDHTKNWEDMEEHNSLLLEKLGSFLNKFNIHLSYDLAILFLGICPPKRIYEIRVHIKNWM